MAIQFVGDFNVNPALTAGIQAGFNGLTNGIVSRFTPEGEKTRRDWRTSKIEAAIAGDPEAKSWVQSQGIDIWYAPNPNFGKPGHEKERSTEFVPVPKGTDFQGITKGAQGSENFRKLDLENPLNAWQMNVPPAASQQEGNQQVPGQEGLQQLLASILKPQQFGTYQLAPQTIRGYKEGGTAKDNIPAIIASRPCDRPVRSLLDLTWLRAGKNRRAFSRVAP